MFHLTSFLFGLVTGIALVLVLTIAAVWRTARKATMAKAEATKQAAAVMGNLFGNAPGGADTTTKGPSPN